MKSAIIRRILRLIQTNVVLLVNLKIRKGAINNTLDFYIFFIDFKTDTVHINKNQ